MTIGRRTDETVATRPEWMPLVAQAMERRSVRGLPKPPPGIEYHRGAYYTCTSVERNDGTVRRTLKWAWPGHCVTIGAYTEPANHRDTYPVGKVITMSDGWQGRVYLCPNGIPYTVPLAYEELMKREGEP